VGCAESGNRPAASPAAQALDGRHR
jgi:hypothetical protein